MAAKRLLQLINGRIRSVLGVVVSTGASNDGDFPCLDASGRLDSSVMPAGFGQNNVSAIASEALAANDLVNLYNNAGTINARKADATTEGKEANGFVKSSVSNGAAATVYTSGNIITGLSGLTPGARQFLAITAGQRTETPPSAAGNVVMLVGVAASATTLVFEPEEPVTLS